jgi:hypothetical protein
MESSSWQRPQVRMRIVPDYTFHNAPEPAIVVVPAQRGRSPKMLQ